MGIERPNAGSVLLDGAEMAGWPTHAIARAGVGIVFQHSRPLHRQTVLENIKLAPPARQAAAAGGRPVRRRSARAPSPSASGWTRVLHRHPATLPFADLRRLELAKAIARDPKVVLVDEPFAGLTAAEVGTFSALIDGFRRDGPRGAAGRPQRQGRRRPGRPGAGDVSRRAHRRGHGRRGDARRDGAPRLSRRQDRDPLRAPSWTAARASRCSMCADVGVLYGKAQALDSVSLHVREGEFVSVVGLNGAGKTTLFNAISGLVPYSGGVRFGAAPLARPQRRRDRARRHRAMPRDARAVRRHERAREPRPRRPAPGDRRRGRGSSTGCSSCSRSCNRARARRRARCQAASSRCWRSRAR